MATGTDGGGDRPGDQPASAWQPVSADSLLALPPASLGPGNVPAGGNLRLDIGWDAFEQLLTSIARYVLGLNQIRFRRYGVPGQAQHGIDLAGRRADGAYTVVQCKEVADFTAAALREAVEKFATGRRPFNAQHFVVATSHPDARTTQVQEELAALQEKYRVDFELDLWGPDELNDVLRERADIVARFWTRETATTFCTGAPLPGVAAAPPDWTRVADQVLLSPLGVDGLDHEVVEAERSEAADPAEAAQAYGRIAQRLAADGFAGHAQVMWRRQLDALAAADDFDAATTLAARLAATALHDGDLDQARLLNHQLERMAHRTPETRTEPSATTARHAALIQAAVHAVEHPLGSNDALLSVLRDEPEGVPLPDYQPMLVLLLSELLRADALAAMPSGDATRDSAAPEVETADLAELIRNAIDQRSAMSGSRNEDLTLRLRMALSDYDADARVRLLTEARQLRIPRPHAALVLAAEARREAGAGSSDDALENWRQATANAIYDGRTDDAAGWLYAIRAVHIRYGPWTDKLDEEHLLAQALPRSSSGPIVRRVRDFENDARRAALAAKPIDAIRSARRWLADSIVAGDWANEDAAAELLADLYAANAEPDRAAALYQFGGKTKKLLELVQAIGDHRLPVADLEPGPWWRCEASLALIAAQHDLLPDDVARELLVNVLDLVARGRAGELTDGPTHALSTQAMKTACVLAARGSSTDAQASLDLLAEDVTRAENQHRYHDREHVEACLDIAEHHRDLALVAFVRLFDLAEVGTHDALRMLTNDRVLDALRETATSERVALLAPAERELLIARLRTMAAAGRYDAAIALAGLGLIDDVVTERATAARDRLREWPEPDGRSTSFGTSMVPDSYLVTFLSKEDRRACAARMLKLAEDHREAASNRHDALTAVCNLVADDDDKFRADIHTRSRSFARGERDGSWLDDQTTNPHPLSSMKINFGPSSLRASGLRLAHFTAVTHEDRTWVRDNAVAMLRGNDDREVRTAAIILSGLPADLLQGLDPVLLAGHPIRAVRQLAVVIATSEPETYASTLRDLTEDADQAVRVLLTHRLHEARVKSLAQPIVNEMLATLSHDLRHSVRRAADNR